VKSVSSRPSSGTAAVAFAVLIPSADGGGTSSRFEPCSVTLPVAEFVFADGFSSVADEHAPMIKIATNPRVAMKAYSFVSPGEVVEPFPTS
jgi:hypothetical protein